MGMLRERGGGGGGRERQKERDFVNGRVCFNLVVYMQLTGSIGHV